jgi:hypothetical protein
VARVSEGVRGEVEVVVVVVSFVFCGGGVRGLVCAKRENKKKKKKKEETKQPNRKKWIESTPWKNGGVVCGIYSLLFSFFFSRSGPSCCVIHTHTTHRDVSVQTHPKKQKEHKPYAKLPTTQNQSELL